ncbi:hypothetical protein E4T50_08835 [Aureobasidium sp. EXF-12298]|nr:hypothetical protein E4T50_08835 [Aureobasidium sp. EXF-12298]KAI4755710.1 hypothetical protein E4T51_11212 [Aureobasidium sp. EXF-12344]KAI4772788.1 hypothetical protein E4T52_12239 [Aureobasidium sp. EXF-3400]
MLTFAATFSLLVSLASAAAVANPQQLLVQDALVPALNHINQTNFKKFAVEDMSDAKFRLHHHAVKAMLGDESYLLLRKAEIEARESDVWDYLWKHELSCGDWMNEDDEEEEDPYRPKVYLSGGRVFDADPKSVPQDVIDALEKLSRREWELRSELNHERWCNVNKTDNPLGEKTVGDLSKKAEPEWKAIVPEEYLQYQIPDSVLEIERKASDDKWKAKDEKHKQDILAGRVSVRNMRMPDLSKCEKLEIHVWDDDY